MTTTNTPNKQETFQVTLYGTRTLTESVTIEVELPSDPSLESKAALADRARQIVQHRLDNHWAEFIPTVDERVVSINFEVDEEHDVEIDHETADIAALEED